MNVNDEADRLMALLDVALASVRKGDGQSALLAVKEAAESAQRLPQKAICLSDRSGERI